MPDELARPTARTTDGTNGPGKAMARGALPFRLGTTSFIYRDAVLPNVRKLSTLVDDVEIVLYEYNEWNPLPGPEALAALQEVAATDQITYTIHLPLDLALADRDATNRSQSVMTAREIMVMTACLNPWAWIVHGEPAPDTRDGWAGWRWAAGESLRRLADVAGYLVGEPSRLCLENLESASPDLPLELADPLGIGVCLDIGHLFKRGLDAARYLDGSSFSADRMRVIHLHGWDGTRDHVSLDRLAPGVLAPVARNLWCRPYAGVVTLEIFSEGDLLRSWQCLRGGGQGCRQYGQEADHG